MAIQKEADPINGWVYDLILRIFDVPINLFFREVYPRGAWKIPKDGAVIFVAAPHANQVWV
jgi:glycerol-3-phosphate O-acyltransferase/dihydroxyacetone phosphate acyltransferase